MRTVAMSRLDVAVRGGACEVCGLITPPRGPPGLVMDRQGRLLRGF